MNLPNGDRPDGYFSAWRAAIVSVQADQSGPYTDVDSFTMKGVRFNAAPLVIRDAWGYAEHAVALGATDGNLYLFKPGAFKDGPLLAHACSSLLPTPSHQFGNYFAGISGNYLAASSGGSVAFIMHNGTFTDNQEYFFGVVTGAMYPLPTDVTPTRTPSPTRAPGSSPLPTQKSDPSDNFASYEQKVDVAAAVFGTLGGLVVVAAVIVFFLPTAGFMLGQNLIVPADYIRSAAGAVWSGASAGGRGVGGAVSGAYAGATSGARGAPAVSLKTPAYAASSESASLLRGAK